MADLRASPNPIRTGMLDDDAGPRQPRQELERLVSVRGHHHGVPLVSERVPERVADIGLVVDDEHGLRMHSSHTRDGWNAGFA
jgi:hypothetical protein